MHPVSANAAPNAVLTRTPHATPSRGSVALILSARTTTPAIPIMYPVHDSPSDSVPDFYVNFTGYDIEEDPTEFDMGHFDSTGSGSGTVEYGEDFDLSTSPEDVQGFQPDEDPTDGVDNGFLFDVEDFDPNAGGGGRN